MYNNIVEICMFSRYYFIDGLCPILNSDKSYFINYLGQVKDKLGNDVPIKRDENNDLIVNIKSWNGIQDYRIIDLMIIHFKSIRFPSDLFNEIHGFVIDGNKENVQAKNIGYRFKCGKIECREYPGFYYVPGFTLYAINKDAVLINTKTGLKVEWYLTKPDKRKNIKGGYYFASLYGASNKRQYLGRHRALALTFLDYPDDCDRLVVNHKDGIPGNDFIDNLEWLSRSGNLIHAYENNLRNQNKPVLVRNVLTDEIKEYFSISECARQLGYSTDETIRQRLLNNGPDKVHQDGTQIKFKDDSRSWSYPKDPNQEIKKAQFRFKIKVRNCLDLSIKEYDSILDASNELKISNVTIKYRLDKNDCSPLRGYQFMYFYDTRPFPTFTKEEYLNTLQSDTIEVDAKNHFTGEEIRFTSINKACKYFKISFSAILRKKKQLLYPNGWQIKRSDQDWKIYPNLEEALYKARKEVMAKRESDGLVLIAENAFEMSKILQIDSKALREAAFTRGNKLYHGYRFRLGISSEPWPV